MPCSDQTEELELQLDGEDRILRFSLNKQTCHQSVGGSQLLPHILGRTVEEALALEPEHLTQDSSDGETDIEGFLLLKQLFSLRYALAVLTGGAVGGVDDPVAVESIACDGQGTWLSARVAVDLISREIQACGGCGCSIPAGHARAKQAAPR